MFDNLRAFLVSRIEKYVVRLSGQWSLEQITGKSQRKLSDKGEQNLGLNYVYI